MARPAIIGIAGPARAGKDTVANFIIAASGGYRYSFADPIREMMLPLGINMLDPYWAEHKEEIIPALGVSPRRIMQTLGTEWGRQLINKDLWLLLAQQRLLRNGPGMVLADIRFENEAEWVRKHKGLVIHLRRTGAEPVQEHASEAGVLFLNADYLMVNDGSLETLQDTVRSMVSGF